MRYFPHHIFDVFLHYLAKLKIYNSTIFNYSFCIPYLKSVYYVVTIAGLFSHTQKCSY